LAQEIGRRCWANPPGTGGGRRRRQRDAGRSAGDGPAADAFAALAERITEALPPVEMSDCTARLLIKSKPRWGRKPDVQIGEDFDSVLAAAQIGAEWAIEVLYRELNPGSFVTSGCRRRRS